MKTVLRSVLLAAAVAFIALSPADAEAQSMNRIAGWFKIYDEALANWDVVDDENSDLKATLVRKTPGTGPQKRVFVLYPRKSSAYDVAMTKILTVFAEKDLNVKFTVENYTNKTDAGKAVMAQAYKDGYDLIFSMGSESTAFLYQNFRDSKIPVVTVCSKDPVQLGQMKDYESGSGINFAFTSLNVLLEVQMAYLKELKPNLKNIGILVDLKNTSAVETQGRPIAEAARKEGINAFDVAVDDPAMAKDQLAQVVPAAVARMRKNDPELKDSVFWVTGSTSVFVEMATINQHSDKVPVISVVPENVQEGPDSAVMSIGVSFDSNAHLAAIYGADVVTGKTEASKMKVGVVSPPDIALNFLRARDIGLKVPFSFFEASAYVYDHVGKVVRNKGQSVVKSGGDS